MKAYSIVLLPGDGVGPEVTAQAVQVLQAVAVRVGFEITFTTLPFGGAAIDQCGVPLPDETRDACLQADAVLLGAVGGPRWDHLTGVLRPEAGLLQLRKTLGVYANLRPVGVPPSLTEASPLRRTRVAGTDLLIVRELTGGIYFGEPRERTGAGDSEMACDTMRYTAVEIERVAHTAFQWAERRTGRVTSVDKANVLSSSQLWRDVVNRVHREAYPTLTLQHLYVDNAAMQLVRAPCDFDVILTANLFGDILSDLAATLPGSLGMLPSASVGGPVGLFEPVHGSAPDIAQTGQANPIAMILSAAMMLDTLGEPAAAQAIRDAVNVVLAHGYRTPDLATANTTTIRTEQMGLRIKEALVQPSHAFLATS